MGSLREILGRDLVRSLAEDVDRHVEVIPGDGPPVTDDDLADLPEPVRRYLDFMRVVGRARDWSFCARLSGRFRLRPKQRFMPMDAWQYNTSHPVARLVHMRIDFAGFLPLVGRDSYVGGGGEMRGKLLGVVPVVRGTGDEFDISGLATWLDEAVMLSPSMLLDARTTWSAVDDHSFDVSFTDSPRTVSGRVFIDERGAPLDFATTDRYAALRSGLVRTEWRTPVDSFEMVDERPRPGLVRAVWHLPEGPFTYVEGRFHSASYNLVLRDDGS